jgi:formylglycine-generating enzyme required for sulfatase activity
MAHWQKWLRCLGQAVWQEVPQAIANLIPFGERLLGVGVRFRNLLRHEQNADESRAALAELVTANPAAIRAEALAIAQRVAADQSPQVQEKLAHYLELAPLVTQQSLKRPDDQHGLTVPAQLVLDQPRHLLPFIPPAPPRFKPRDTFRAGRLQGWVLVSRLGAGGFGEVWKARHPDDEGLFAAVKFCLDDSARQLLAREARVLAQVRQLGQSLPGIVRLDDFDVKANPPWLRFEFVDGGDLLGHAAEYFGLRATPLIQELAQNVGRFHRLHPPVVHRDLKPANILLKNKPGGDYDVRIADFGISATSGWALEQERLHTRPSAALPTDLVGSHTPVYASPQQRRGDAPDPRDDVYALGVLWYQLLIGDLASLCPSGDWQEDIVALGLSQSLVKLLGSCCNNHAAKRPKDAAVLAEGIARCQAGPVSPGRLPSPPPAPTPPPAPSRLAAIASEKKRQREQQERQAKAQAKAQAQQAEIQALEKDIEQAVHTDCWKPRHRDRILRLKELQPARTAELDQLLGLLPQWPPVAFTSTLLQMPFVLVPAGTFWMGGEGGKPSDRPVTIPHHFYLGVYPVTQGQWQILMPDNPSPSWFSRTGGGKDQVKGISDADLRQFPVDCVSWEDAQEFLRRLNTNEPNGGWTYRLPTEAEWEYACREGAASKEECSHDFYLDQPSDTLSSSQANFGNNLGRTSKVGSYRPNQLGICDLHGNVWEWCEDSHGGGSGRVLRGGCWYYDASSCRAAYPYNGAPSARRSDLGLRVARVPSGK